MLAQLAGRQHRTAHTPLTRRDCVDPADRVSAYGRILVQFAVHARRFVVGIAHARCRRAWRTRHRALRVLPDRAGRRSCSSRRCPVCGPLTWRRRARSASLGRVAVLVGEIRQPVGGLTKLRRTEAARQFGQVGLHLVAQVSRNMERAASRRTPRRPSRVLARRRRAAAPQRHWAASAAAILQSSPVAVPAAPRP